MKQKHRGSIASDTCRACGMTREEAIDRHWFPYICPCWKLRLPKRKEK